jgi:uncharacterized protein (DUF433 family)
MQDLLERITVDSEVMAGKPVIRGSRIPVELILRELGNGLTTEEIIETYPRLTREDIRAANAYAARIVADEDVFVS